MFQSRFTSKASVATLALAALSLAAVHPAQAQTTIAADDSSNYNGSDLTTLNGGSGFTGPFIVTQGGGSFSLSNSRLNGGGGGGTPTGAGINDANNLAFRIKTINNTEAVQRTLSTPLSVGSTFSFAFDNGYIDSGGGQRMVLGTAANNYAVEFGFAGGAGNYEFNGTEVSGFGFTDGGLNVSFTLNTPTTYTMTAIKLNDNSSYTYNGTLGSALNLDIITFQTYDPGHDQYHDFYFNNLSVVAPAPEPSPAVALTVGMLSVGGLMVARRRQHRCAA